MSHTQSHSNEIIGRNYYIIKTIGLNSLRFRFVRLLLAVSLFCFAFVKILRKSVLFDSFFLYTFDCLEKKTESRIEKPHFQQRTILALCEKKKKRERERAKTTM